MYNISEKDKKIVAAVFASRGEPEGCSVGYTSSFTHVSMYLCENGYIVEPK